MCEKNPEYVTNLENLPQVEKMRLLYGSWNAKPEGAGYFKREWLRIVRERPERAQRVRAWDIAVSEPSDVYPNPDYTVGVLMSKDQRGVYTIEDVVRFRASSGKVEDMILEVARDDGENVTVALPEDPGAGGKFLIKYLGSAMTNAGFRVKPMKTSRSKLNRFQPFASSCELGNVQIIPGPWDEEFLDELENFLVIKNSKDD